MFWQHPCVRYKENHANSLTMSCLIALTLDTASCIPWYQKPLLCLKNVPSWLGLLLPLPWLPRNNGLWAYTLQIMSFNFGQDILGSFIENKCLRSACLPTRFGWAKIVRVGLEILAALSPCIAFPMLLSQSACAREKHAFFFSKD